MKTSTEDDLLRRTSDIVSAFVSNNSLTASELPKLIRATHETLQDLGSGDAYASPPKPAVPISKSIQKDYLVCLEDGRKLKMLKRYLRARYDMTPDDYRARWNLPASYPMVSPSYAELRSKHAKEIGLGRNKTSQKTNELEDAE